MERDLSEAQPPNAASQARVTAKSGVTAQPGLAPGPFLKWAGGKGRLIGQLKALLPQGYAMRRHLEPFVGGGALFFALKPERAVLMDLNVELVRTYRVVRDAPEALMAALEPLRASHSETNYYATRELYNARKVRGDIARAACFIYLNKTCFNGLHRVNQQGHFNVPFGRYTAPRIFDRDTLLRASEVLKPVDLREASFERVLKVAAPGDFVYFDPPYDPLSETSSFTSYAEGDGFSRADQARLRDVFVALHKRGCKVMLSNNDTPYIRELFGDWHIDVVVAPRAISCDRSSRQPVTEVVVRNYR